LSDPLSEQALARGARAGSASDFSKLVAAHQGALRNFLRRLSGNHADADDIAQESFVFAWEHIARFDPARPFRPWLFGIAWRKYRQGKRGWLRLVMRESRVAQDDGIAQADPDLGLDLATALKALSPEQRAAALLCLAAGFTHGEAAEALALPLGTVKSHVARGREKLAGDMPTDPHFVMAVMARIEQRRFRRELMRTGVLAGLAALLLALVMPALENIWGKSFAPLMTNLPQANVMVAAVLLTLVIAGPRLLWTRGV
jgi:RNA polymerase sigma-70 factor (ECF subfamily)